MLTSILALYVFNSAALNCIAEVKGNLKYCFNLVIVYVKPVRGMNVKGCAVQDKMC